MRHILGLFAALFLCGFFATPRPATACPMCAEAVPQKSDAEEDDQAREASAYNFSICLMAGTPFLLLTGVGLLVYRGLNKRTGGGLEA